MIILTMVSLLLSDSLYIYLPSSPSLPFDMIPFILYSSPYRVTLSNAMVPYNSVLLSHITHLPWLVNCVVMFFSTIYFRDTGLYFNVTVSVITFPNLSVIFTTNVPLSDIGITAGSLDSTEPDATKYVSAELYTSTVYGKFIFDGITVMFPLA